jgi:CRISPR system Cascade subunit CasC
MTQTATMVQVHLLTSYPAALLNRDDAGLAKRMPFGGTIRTRISSQCLKKHWREASIIAQSGTSAVRSRLVFDRFVAEPLVAEHGMTEAEAGAIARLLMEAMLAGKDDGAGDAGDGEEDTADGGTSDPGAQSKQVLVLSEPEARWLTSTALEVAALARQEGIALDNAAQLKKLVGRKENKPFWRARTEILEALPASVDVALFGRFITSDLLARVDTAVSVSHALTTHAELAETDYFTAMDMLDTSSSGAGHLNDTELTSGVFYTYAVIDLAQLEANLGPERERAAELAARLIRTMATVGPTAKRGSTAPFALAEFVLVERGDTQPRSLANAFRQAVPLPRTGASDLMSDSVRALLAHRRVLGEMYGADPSAVVATIHRDAVGDTLPVLPLDGAIAQALGLESGVPVWTPVATDVSGQGAQA